MIETVITATDGWNGIEVDALSRRCHVAVAEETEDPRLARVATALFTDDGEVAELNAQWRGKEGPTNVLSFPAEEIPGLPDEAQPLGDIALAEGVCRREAEEKGITAEDHTAHLIVHGLLHLLGYDHIDEGEAAEMEDLERSILERLGIADPYGEATDD